MSERPPARDIAAAKLNLALHVRGKRGDGRHDIETLFAFCTDGDRVRANYADTLHLTIEGPFATGLSPGEDNLVMRAARALQAAAGGKTGGAAITLDKRLPVASGIGGGSADAAATLRLLTGLWGVDPQLAVDIAPKLGSDVPACLLSLPALGSGAGDRLQIVDLGLSGTPVLLVNPRVEVSTRAIFEAWDGIDRGPLSDWRDGRNDLQAAAIGMVPQIATVLTFLETQPGVDVARMSGSGATCFALFDSERARDEASERVPPEWWHLGTSLR